jgi:hypothetical protein
MAALAGAFAIFAGKDVPKKMAFSGEVNLEGAFLGIGGLWDKNMVADQVTALHEADCNALVVHRDVVGLYEEESRKQGAGIDVRGVTNIIDLAELVCGWKAWKPKKK